MTLQVIGSGLGRTGTMSLKGALEQLLGGPCYHMVEVFANQDHPTAWTAGCRGQDVDWETVLDGYVATVDWPAAACWKELAAAFPDAVILHSERPADAWFRSADATIFETFKKPRATWGDRMGGGEFGDAWAEMAETMFTERFTPGFLDRDTAMAAVEAWNADVRATADPDRLVIWSPGDGWAPICAALGLTVPEAEFPHANSTEEFRQRAGYDDA